MQSSASVNLNQKSGSDFRGWYINTVFIAVILFFLGLLAFDYLQAASDSIDVGGNTIVIINNHHAVTKHGDGALNARRCLDQHGTWQVFRSDADRKVFALTCRDSLGNFYMRIIEWMYENVFRERTAYSFASRSWTEVATSIMKSEFTKYGGSLLP